MHWKSIRYPFLWIVGIVLLVGIIAGIFITFRYYHSHIVPKSAADMARLHELIFSSEKSYWNDPNLSLKRAEQAISLAEKTGDSGYLARAYFKKAGCLQVLDRSDSSLVWYRRCLAISQQMHNDTLSAKCMNGIANYYLRKENYQKAIFYLTEALKLSERISYKPVTGLIYNGLGLVSISMREFDQAISYFTRAREICKETGDLANEAGISVNIANCYAEKNDFARARYFYEENLASLLKIGDTSQIVLACINLGTVNRYLGDNSESFRYLDQATGYLKKYKDQSLLCTALLETGTTWLEAGNLQNARKYLKESLAISTGTLSKTNSMEALLRLSEIEEKEGNVRQSLEYFKKYTVIKDSVMNDETRRSVAEIQLKYDVQKKEYENELLNKKYELQKRKTLTLWLIFTSFILVVLLIGVLIWLLYKNLRKSYRLQEVMNAHLQERIESDEKINQLEKQKFQAEIEARNKELTTTSLQLVAKNKILSDISKITEDYYQAKSIDRESYKGLQRIINENLNSDKEWEQFKEMFEKVHNEFFTGLKNRFPELSESELRLCAYLKINLQNKEIAKILNVSPATITTTRYRIRKKIRIDNKVVLEDFLRSF